MKQFLLSIAALILVQISCGQEFSFQMYFEDADGQLDTLTFGYDAGATDTIDPAFGEEDISNLDFSSNFEVRISDFTYPDFELFLPGPAAFQTKRQIKEKDCESEDFPLVSAINLSQVTYPIKVYWEHSLFEATCLQQSLITDWHPGGWFDAVHGGEQGPFYLDSQDTVEFTHTTHQMITANNDTTDVLFFTLASVDNFITEIENIKRPKIKALHPNPTNGDVKIDIQAGIKIEEIQVFDVNGKHYEVNWSQDNLDMYKLPDGIYLIRLKLSNNRIIHQKVLKNTM
ncbi:MAG: T9SS type A sorting domain-containing protein [Bacteroidota bacterium]